MEIDRILFPIQSLGPGNRLVIWTVGCSKHCFNCSNEELWERDDKRNISPDEIVELIIKSVDIDQIDGITFTGGDPLEQVEDLLETIKKLRDYCKDFLVYTGYTIEEIKQSLQPKTIQDLEANISVLIEGRYVDELNDSKVPLRGSTNQRIIYFDPSIGNKYFLYMNAGRKVQNVYSGEKVISVGIHNKDHKEA